MAYSSFRDCARFHDCFDFKGRTIVLYSHHLIEESDGSFDIFVDLDDETFAGDIYDVNFVRKYLSTGVGFFHAAHGIILKNIDTDSIRAAVHELLDNKMLKEVFVLSE